MNIYSFNKTGGTILPRTKEQYEAMRIATKEKIQAAAIKLFTQKGYAATNVQDIADKAGISTGLMYRHYKSKDDLFNSLVREAAEGLSRITKAFQSDASPIDLIWQLTAEILDDLTKNDEFAEYTILMNQSIMMEKTIPQVLNLIEQSSAMMNQTAQLIEKGQKLGQFKEGDSYGMALYYYASVQGLAEMKLTLKDRFVTPSMKIVTAFLIKEELYDD